MEVLKRKHVNSENVPQPGSKVFSKSKVLCARRPLVDLTSNRPLKVQKSSAGSIKGKLGLKKVVENAAIVKKISLPTIASHSTAQLPANVEDIDKGDLDSPHLASVYVKDIYKYLRELEVLYPIKENFLSHQSEVTDRMRAILVDWLVQVHQRFHLLQETLYLTVSIIDRYLQEENVKKSQLQLVGITAMFIASKFEEMDYPDLFDFVYITDNSYTKTSVLKMEQRMLNTLGFNLSKPLPLHFLRRYSKAGNVDSTLHALGKYLMELTLTEYNLAHHPPSLLAAAASYLSIVLLSDLSWSETMQYYSQYSENEVLPLAKNMCKLILKADSATKIKAVYVKYASSKMLKISMNPQLKSLFVASLAAS